MAPIDLDDRVARFADFDAATVYEAAGQCGMVDPAIRPVWEGARVCGPAITVECPAADNLMLHVAVTRATPGSVIVATATGYLRAGAWGEILTAAAQARGIAGLIFDGAVRDVDALRQARFPVFSRGLAIGACTKTKAGRIGVPIDVGGVTIRPGDVVLGDADGIVVIDQARLDEVYQGAVQRRGREREIIAQLRQGRTTIEILGLEVPPGFEPH